METDHVLPSLYSCQVLVALNRAVAVATVQGPAAGLDALDAAATLAGDSAPAGYHLFPSVRGDLLMKMGRLSEAREEIQRAVAMTKNLREQELLENRLKQLEKGGLLRIGTVLSFETPQGLSSCSHSYSRRTP
jgi:predicted RNA polymerase sigma factor